MVAPEKSGKELIWEIDGEVVFSMMDHPEPAESRPVLGLLTPQEYMRQELEKLSQEFQFVPLAPGEIDWSDDTIEHWTNVLKSAGATGVLGLAQKDAWHHALLNQALDKVSLSSLCYLVAMSKFLQRAVVEELMPDMWFVPINPNQEVDSNKLAVTVPEWPCMFKNTTLSRGDGVYKCDQPEEMIEIIELYRKDGDLQNRIKEMDDGVVRQLNDADRAKLDELTDGKGPPPFLCEKLIDMTVEWIEYCYEGCINEEGTHKCYGITEKMYFEDAACFGRVTPPVNLHAAHIAKAEEFVNGVAAKFVDVGYRRQFFNLDVWISNGRDENAEPKFLLCELNPRCVHSFQRMYRAAYGNNMYRDNAKLVLENKLPEQAPWDLWNAGEARVGCIMFVNVKNQVDPETGEEVVDIEGTKAGDLADYALVRELEDSGELLQVRRTRTEDHVMTREEGRSNPGTTLMQLWIEAETHEELAAKEMELRKRIYKIEQPFSKYPEYWLELAAAAPATS
jgi:hypothetical protein